MNDYSYDNSVVSKIKRKIMLVVKHKHFAMGTALAAIIGFGLLAGNDVKADTIDPFAVQAQSPSSTMYQKRVALEVFCANSEILYEVLEEEYGESPVAMSINQSSQNGIGPEGAYLIWFANADRSTFSIVSDGGAGVSCIVFSGSCDIGNCFIPNGSLWEE